MMASVGPDRSGNVTARRAPAPGPGSRRPPTRKFHDRDEFALNCPQNALGQNRIYAVNQSQHGQLLSYGDDGNPGNVPAPVTVGFDDWLDFRYLFAGRNLAGANRIYAVPA
jgi:hypothetical protein